MSILHVTSQFAYSSLSPIVSEPKFLNTDHFVIYILKLPLLNKQLERF